MSTARFEAAFDGATSSRDLASVELWQRSLARSRQRRRLTELGRKARRRRKSVSLALSAALAAGPVLPQTVAADSSSGSGPANPTGSGDGQAAGTASARVVLELGSRGPLVAAAQRRLNEILPFTHLTVDGIYGPLTRGAVVNFQRQHGLTASGALDVRTWATMFNAPVLIMGGGSGSAASEPAPVTRAASTSIAQSGRRAFASEKTAVGASLVTARMAARAVDLTPRTGASRSVGASVSASGGTVPREAAAKPAMTSPADTSGGVSQPTAIGGSSRSGSSNAPTGARGTPEHAGGAPVYTGAPANAGAPVNAGAPAGRGASSTSSPPSSGAPSVTVVAPTTSTPQTSTYVLTDGVALPLPRQYITNPYVDQGVDYSAPGGTPLYAMGDGVIVGAGISGFGPNAPILKITSGPLNGLEVYYGHSGPNLVHVGQQVKAGQAISQVGSGIVGISTGPHLEIGFYPPGPMGSGSRMLSVINGLLRDHPSGRVWGTAVGTVHAAADVGHTTRVASIGKTSSAKSSRWKTSSAPAIARRHRSSIRSTGSAPGHATGGVAPGSGAAAPERAVPAAASSGAASVAQGGGAAPATGTAPTTAPAPATTSPARSSASAPETSTAPTTAPAPAARPAPATAGTSSTPAPAPATTGTSSTPAPAPATTGTSSTPAPAPATTGTSSTPAPAPATTGTSSTPAPAPATTGTSSTPAPAPATTSAASAAPPSSGGAPNVAGASGSTQTATSAGPATPAGGVTSSQSAAGGAASTGGASVSAG